MCDGDCERGPENTEGDSGSHRTDGGVLSLDEILDCFRNERRRTVLYCCQDEEVLEIEELATRVIEREHGVAREQISDSHREQVEINLAHHHLPKLAEAHLIEYDHRSTTVRCSDPPRILDEVIRLLAKLEAQTAS